MSDDKPSNPLLGILKLFLRLFLFAGKIGVRTLRMVFFRKKKKQPDQLEDGGD